MEVTFSSLQNKAPTLFCLTFPPLPGGSFKRHNEKRQQEKADAARDSSSHQHFRMKTSSCPHYEPPREAGMT